MKPTIGRIVRFFPGANLTFAGNSTPRVWSDTCVNLRLLTDGPDVPWSGAARLGGPGEQPLVGLAATGGSVKRTITREYDEQGRLVKETVVEESVDAPAASSSPASSPTRL